MKKDDVQDALLNLFAVKDFAGLLCRSDDGEFTLPACGRIIELAITPAIALLEKIDDEIFKAINATYIPADEKGEL